MSAKSIEHTVGVVYSSKALLDVAKEIHGRSGWKVVTANPLELQEMVFIRDSRYKQNGWIPVATHQTIVASVKHTNIITMETNPWLRLEKIREKQKKSRRARIASECFLR